MLMGEKPKGAARGISPLVATLVLVIITLVGGWMIFSIFRTQVTSRATTAELQVQSIDLVSVDGESIAATTVKNVGTVALENVRVTIRDDDNNDVVLFVGDLAPGQTGGADNSECRWTPGKPYIARIAADVPGGGDVVKAFPVVAHS